ncbi:DUF3048 domain-containing protein [Paenibacillus apiarius]|uniref:DUF3048 domain-containing protein n=1 Tax=Paenibacillus apiarius TaxID=46240 RepID=A0ABT4DZ43_9BACL|nr:DUF3048 domain-containing protein [Paenibacillus apiarius]MCY9515121.1 DUF3048 domain-containing protein [Paenibacillus apiarius]MCY9522629.1 DUF3048 domain-containing protein [Paenibacillus apiarius]MCY9550327.1 DUF3048 domain-containing protein [Paenibacillus apiarius]MCY9560725.1 DUF3048 domain-containing protein [Paenibacillus apiarius]MCY9686706.1 DUF3048 domain-containing protein [Paenibacillus apiarius]
MLGKLRVMVIGSLCMLMLAMTACQSGAGKGIATEPPAMEREDGVNALDGSESEERQPAPFRAPFTGLEAQEPLKKRPIAVMVNNFKSARPQSGLSFADMLIEVLAEGGITRIVAIYHSQYDYDGAIGPVRSIRPYLIELGESFHAVLVHAGGSNDAYSILQKQRKPYLDEITNAGRAFWRESFRKAPHNLYTKLSKITEAAATRFPMEDEALPAFSFAPLHTEIEASAAMPSTSQPSASSEAASRIEVAFMNNGDRVQYAYDYNSGNYIRHINGEPHLDMATDKPLTADNVLVLAAPHRVLDNVGRLEVQLDGGGEALLFTGGRTYSGTWQRNGQGAFAFMQSGQALPLKPGKTHMLIVPHEPPLLQHVDWE